MTEQRDFAALVERLVELESRDGELEIEDAMERASLHKRITALLSEPGRAPADERRQSVRVPGDLKIKLIGGGVELEARLVDVGEGGVQVIAASLPQVDTVDIELVAEPPLPANEQPPRARARVTWTRSQGEGVALGLAFLAQLDGHRRRMRRLVMNVLKRIKK